MVRLGTPATQFTAGGAEALDYNNPFNLTMERVWFDGKIVYAVDMGEVDVDRDRVQVAQEYQIVYDVGLHSLPVVFCVDRAGITGDDGPSHHGLFDLALLTKVPGMTVFATPITSHV